MMNKKEGALTNGQIVTLAVAELGGDANAVDIEDIAIRVYEIAPDRFCWRKHPDRIDLRVVQYALRDAAKNNKPLLSGGVRHGYMLTSAGVAWASGTHESANNMRLDSGRKNSFGERLALEKTRLLSSKTLQKFRSGAKHEITYIDFQEFVRIDDYFPQHVRLKRYQIVENAVQDEADLQELWTMLKAQFLAKVE